jgi:beta-RFAP synthase
LGTGTQLGLAVAKALAVAHGKSDWDAVALARRVERGRRSAIGVHGFQHGGFLVDGGKTATTTLAPLIARHDFPAEWAVLLIMPTDVQGAHGPRESAAFEHLAKSDACGQQTDALCGLAVLGILPALVERDLAAFGEALYEFNRRVGEMFKPWQGGIYSCAQSAAVVDFCRSSGIRGVGQSSWGPTVFAIDSAERLGHVAELLLKQSGFSLEQVLISGANASGAAARRLDV